MARKQYSTSLDEKILKQLKIKAVQEDKPVNEILEKLIAKYLEGVIKLD